MRRQDFITVYFTNGMHRTVKREQHVDINPVRQGLIHQMNVSGHCHVDFHQG